MLPKFDRAGIHKKVPPYTGAVTLVTGRVPVIHRKTAKGCPPSSCGMRANGNGAEGFVDSDQVLSTLWTGCPHSYPQVCITAENERDCPHVSIPMIADGMAGAKRW
ncbi:protein of unknown function [Kyrpidia spormannii]|uniref:Uncharacterized protein n=2 Tax=Kyrpidia spormannii TaxID=2055160 RepID=A0ACA8Z5P0_9BACL|nr:protein of unknown function [Kyrpidia spormannii]CAB3389615.1 protein of unknown function [Kyrpidia spormannii]